MWSQIGHHLRQHHTLAVRSLDVPGPEELEGEEELLEPAWDDKGAELT